MKKMFCCLLFLFQSNYLFSQSDSIYLHEKPKFQSIQFVPPVALMMAGLLTNGNGRESLKNEIVEERNEHFSHFRTHLDDYLQFSPSVVAYGLDAAGIKSRTDAANRTAILLKAEIMMMGSVTVLKNVTHKIRPDGSSYNSFPPGHTAQAFAAATFLSEEYGRRYQWMPYAAYGTASAVGSLRMANNRHYISDGLMGAGIGILSVKVSYWTHRYKWGHKPKTSFVY
ncbi:phosphatase PAP2 family protein [Dyadobacter sp. LHD-138]|uniref:phosphatase PAP2 family protein n=1 Tax=Dyadobacter sp. LHD-138 TaxID=3071413 RepID=UPI0027DFFEC2|nr:phosphatase PAP2 family protein [Dyadobacter sp. LHD-138]MDQ6479888.1 phosphatase PAP2 family protein [Dyadobacter sp. LHD-138]